MIIDYLLDFVFPPRCVICGSLTGYGLNIKICNKCAENAEYVENNWDYAYTLNNKFSNRVYFDGGKAVFKYSFVKKSIERFKYFGARSLGKQYAKIMNEYFADSGFFEKADCIVSVPINKHRLKTRGYDQAGYLAEELAEISNIEFIPNGILRHKNTKPQNTLKLKERFENVKDAFVGGDYNFKGKKVIIVDDIFTTGATINECAKVLKSTVAEKVYFLTFAAAGEGLGSDENV